MIIEVKTKEVLSEILHRSGRGYSADCAMHKGCGKCRVKLLSGIWESRGEMLSPPCDAIPCITRLATASGSVEIPDTPAQKPSVASEWFSSAPLPSSSETLIALDVGTTTLAAIKLEGGKITGTAGSFNGQLPFGDNVITRIAKAEKDFSQVRQALLDSILELLEELDLEGVKRIGIAGNTVMSCFLHNISPRSIGQYPFTAPQLSFPESSDLLGDVPVITVPSLTGLLGGDITSGLFESPLEEGEVLIDLGTNCEMVFRTASGFWGTSAAAGPAFEGAGISCGSRAVTGAIDHYKGAGNFSVIGNTTPKSLCGSALVDFLAVERKKGTLSPFGKFVSGQKRMLIAPGISVTEEDISELLKAKAAVSAALKALEKVCGEKIRKIKLAGGFSRHLDLDSARQTGLLPEFPAEVCGNLSLAGALRCAAEPQTVEKMAELTKKIREIHLNDVPGFEEFFTSGLLLP